MDFAALPPHPVSPTASPRARAAWKVGLSLAAIFFFGIVIGVVCTLGVLRAEIARRADPSRWSALLIGRIDRRLHLTPDQRRQIEPLVRSGIEKSAEARDHALAEVIAQIEALNTEAGPILTPDQRLKLDTFIRERVVLLRRWTGGRASAHSLPAPAPAASPAPGSPEPSVAATPR